ncbi:SAGA-associated factor 29 homolog A-like isoform X2 [Panicum virgatum]|uniref:SAGA-associated factor 29 homolog A-like isoform X2 n=1 Tax=Panicum virgatum TaxID=38727 RepID=UPI0019D69B1A|nr:SAGA-associated factor 29 homolog A-like isoform X2 [Panicum virgatum]
MWWPRSTRFTRRSSRDEMPPAGGGELGVLLKELNDLDQLRKEQEVVITKINNVHREICSSPEMVDKSVDAILLKLRGLYTRAKELSESEISASTALIGLLDGLLQSGASTAQRKKIEIGEQKKKRIKSDTDTARFSAASMRNQLDQAANLKGEQVAARVKSDDEKDEWFVVKVIHFDKETKEYEVLDEEPGDDEESTQKKYKLPMSCIIPFPKKGDASSAPDFGQGRQVLAVYPGTTALYRATVASHRKIAKSLMLLSFCHYLDVKPGCEKSRGSLTIIFWSLMMMKRTGLYRKERCRSIGWLPSRRAIGSEDLGVVLQCSVTESARK